MTFVECHMRSSMQKWHRKTVFAIFFTFFNTAFFILITDTYKTWMHLYWALISPWPFSEKTFYLSDKYFSI